MTLTNDVVLYNDVVPTNDVATLDWTNDVVLTAYVALIDELMLTDDMSRFYYIKMLIWC